MSDTAEPISKSDESDLAYLKRMAQAGRGEPAPFLLLMATFGGVYGFSLLILFIGFVVEGMPTPERITTYEPTPIVAFINRWLFVVDHLLFLAALVWTGWRTLGPNRVRLNRAAAATWTAAFIGLVTTFVMMRLFARNEPPTDAVYSAHLMGPILLVLWGCAWWVTAMTSDRKWLLTIAIGSFLAAIGLAWAGNSAANLPIICACLLLLAFLPAVILMRQRAR